jgi:hypothetical protein
MEGARAMKQVNHKDGDPRNNEVSNLEIIEVPEGALNDCAKWYASGYRAGKAAGADEAMATLRDVRAKLAEALEALS